MWGLGLRVEVVGCGVEPAVPLVAHHELQQRDRQLRTLSHFQQSHFQLHVFGVELSGIPET